MSSDQTKYVVNLPLRAEAKWSISSHLPTASSCLWPTDSKDAGRLWRERVHHLQQSQSSAACSHRGASDNFRVFRTTLSSSDHGTGGNQPNPPKDFKQLQGKFKLSWRAWASQECKVRHKVLWWERTLDQTSPEIDVLGVNVSWKDLNLSLLQHLTSLCYKGLSLRDP